MLCCCNSKEDKSLAEVVDIAGAVDDASNFQALVEVDPRILAKARMDQMERISFESDTAAMTTTGKAAAAEYALILKDFPDIVIKLMGFSTEDLPTLAHNKKLGRDRCRTTRAFFEVQNCQNKIAIQGEGKTSGCADEVTVELCEAEQVETLESTATAEDVAFAQEQKEAEEINQNVEEPPAETEPCVEEPAPKEQQVQIRIGFSDETRNITNFQLARRPLGLVVDIGKMPLKVKYFKPGSHAQECGVKAGMVLTVIEGENISNNSFHEAWDKLVAAVSKLPGE